MVLVSGALAAINHNTYIVGGEYVVRKGEIVDGNLGLFFAEVTLEKGARVDGTVLSFSSVVDVYGTVAGNISSLESEVNVRPSAQVKVVPKDTGVFPVVILLPNIARWNLAFGG
jgi:hypothetical protein